MIARIRSGGAYEPRIGYCRATVAGGWIHVSGTVGVDPLTSEVSGDVAIQCAHALAIIERALAEAGAGFADAVRVTYILPDPAEFEACWPVLRAAFGDHPPAATMLSAGLIDPKYRIEIELTAYRP